MPELTVLDTGVLISGVPVRGRIATTSLSFAELEFGVSAAAARGDALGARTRNDRLVRLRARFGRGLPFDADAAAAYGVVTAAVLSAGRSPRGRSTDLWIAAIALSRRATLLTTQPKEFAGLEALLDVQGV